MNKAKLGPSTMVFPMPAFLVGANVCGKANFMTVAWGGIVCSYPPMIAVSLQPKRYTYKGIQENGTFTVNIPSEDLVAETDYCGIVSGSKIDKVGACGFRVFYGQLETAPMVEQCPVNLECKVFQVVELGSHVLVIGEVVQTYVTESCLTDGRPDVSKVRPFIYTSDGVAHYRSFGGSLGSAFKKDRVFKTI